VPRFVARGARVVAVMGDYEHTATIRRPPDEVFDYLSAVENLPSFFDSMRDAHAEGGDDVHVVAEVEGHRYEGEAWMHADPDAKHVRWGAESTSGYHGELFVIGIGDEESKVTVTLHTEHADGPGIRAGLEQTLANLKQQLDGSSTESTG
jgi:uncharacterized protein YndB with AHSA1/START domain